MWIVTGIFGALMLVVGVGAAVAPHANGVEVALISVGAAVLGAVFGKCAGIK